MIKWKRFIILLLSIPILIYLSNIIKAIDLCTFQSPLAVWKLKNDSNDCVGNKIYNLTINNISFDGNKGAIFNSSQNSYLNYTNGSFVDFGTGNFTICFNASISWTPVYQDLMYIVSHWKQADDSGWKILFDQQQQPQFDPNIEMNIGAGSILSKQIGLSNGVFHHYCFRRNDSTAYFFMNGTLISNIANGVNSSTSTNIPFEIGRKTVNNNTYFNGTLNSMAIWNSSLTDSQILQVYNNITNLPFFNTNISGGSFRKATNFTANITIEGSSLNYAWFLTNVTGSWANDTPIALNGISTYRFNNSKNITINKNSVFCWKFAVNTTDDNYNESNLYCDTVANSPPSISSATINDSSPTDVEDLYCNNGTVEDIDNDAVTLFYDWINSTKSTGLNSANLSNWFTNANEDWQCRIWGGDTFNNGSNSTSASVSIATNFVAPIINFTNATTETNGIRSDSTNPTNNNSWINLSVNFTDSNVGDNWTAFFCSTDSFVSGNCSSGNFLCSSLKNQSSNLLSCNYTTLNLAGGAYPYYAFVIDNQSLVSSSKLGSYEINSHPTIPALNFPSNNTFIKVNYTWLNYSSSDLDGDTITYLIYSNASGSSTLIFNGTGISFNYTNIAENISVYWFGSARDDRNHTSENSSQFFFTTDYTNPTINITNPINDSTFSAANLNVSIKFNFTASDRNLQLCYYNVTNSAGGVIIANRLVNCTEDNDTFYIDSFSSNLRANLWANDSAGNSRSITTTFSTVQTLSTGGGGGGGQEAPECISTQDCIAKFKEITYYCVNNKCVLNSTAITELVEGKCGDTICTYGKEDFISCSQDCPFNKTIFTSCIEDEPIKKTQCFIKQRYFSLFVVLLSLLTILFLALRKKKTKKREGI